MRTITAIHAMFFLVHCLLPVHCRADSTRTILGNGFDLELEDGRQALAQSKRPGGERPAHEAHVVEPFAWKHAFRAYVETVLVGATLVAAGAVIAAIAPAWMVTGLGVATVVALSRFTYRNVQIRRGQVEGEGPGFRCKFAAVLVGLGDTVGLSQLSEGIRGEELLTGRKLMTKQAAKRVGQGTGALTLLVAGPLMARGIRSRSVGIVDARAFSSKGGMGQRYVSGKEALIVSNERVIPNWKPGINGPLHKDIYFTADVKLVHGGGAAQRAYRLPVKPTIRIQFPLDNAWVKSVPTVGQVSVGHTQLWTPFHIPLGQGRFVPLCVNVADLAVTLSSDVGSPFLDQDSSNR